jgi:hypothetical protein
METSKLPKIVRLTWMLFALQDQWHGRTLQSVVVSHNIATSCASTLIVVQGPNISSQLSRRGVNACFKLPTIAALLTLWLLDYTSTPLQAFD